MKVPGCEANDCAGTVPFLKCQSSLSNICHWYALLEIFSVSREYSIGVATFQLVLVRLLNRLKEQSP